MKLKLSKKFEADTRSSEIGLQLRVIGPLAVRTESLSSRVFSNTEMTGSDDHFGIMRAATAGGMQVGITSNGGKGEARINDQTSVRVTQNYTKVLGASRLSQEQTSSATRSVRFEGGIKSISVQSDDTVVNIY